VDGLGEAGDIPPASTQCEQLGDGGAGDPKAGSLVGVDLEPSATVGRFDIPIDIDHAVDAGQGLLNLGGKGKPVGVVGPVNLCNQGLKDWRTWRNLGHGEDSVMGTSDG
jgi:hypothetical protein